MRDKKNKAPEGKLPNYRTLSDSEFNALVEQQYGVSPL
jgi:hypothetical protein